MICLLIILIIVLFIFVGIFCGMASEHAYDLAIIRSGSLIVDVNRRYRDDLSKKLESITGDTSGGVLANADSPISSLVSAFASAQRELSMAEERIARARICIEARKAGPFPFIVKIYGEQ